jgi:hypothetical protein
VKSAVLKKIQKHQNNSQKNTCLEKSHDQKLFGSLFSYSACFSDAEWMILFQFILKLNTHCVRETVNANVVLMLVAALFLSWFCHFTRN